MGQQIETMVQRLRRFARALTHDGESADALVLEALASTEEKRFEFNRLLTIILARRRDQEELHTQIRPVRPAVKAPPSSRPDILRAFERLPLADREVIALISVEGLSYEDAAARLTRARAAFARQVDGERHAVLRIVK
jgi:DNA-directed RNA polymerase specialized sigma24 family protein